ncbi:MAG: TIGR02391 family protein [Gallionella sp.]
MERIPCFDTAQLEASCKVLADTNNGLKGDEISHILADIKLADPDPTLTKWKRLFNALALAQNKHQVGNHLVMFINRAMAPARYISTPHLFDLRRDGLNVALAFAGFSIRDDGKVAHTTRETTLAGALARASRLQAVLDSRCTHPEVLKYCRAELLEENYFHAVLEAVKGIAERIRQLSCLNADGAELVNQVFSTKSPVLAINSLQTETEISEQKGIANLLVGLFGAIRNPTAHAPKVIWAMPEQDAIDVFALLSFVHRKLDNATKL